MIGLILIVVFFVVIIASGVYCHLLAKKRGLKKPAFWGVLGFVCGPMVIPFVYWAKD